LVSGLIEAVLNALAAVNNDVTFLEGAVEVSFSRSTDVVCM